MSRTVAETMAFRLSKSDEVMREAKVLIAAESWAGAMNRLYYAAFHTVSVLLLHNDIKHKAHNGAEAMLEFHFVRTGLVSVP